MVASPNGSHLHIRIQTKLEVHPQPPERTMKTHLSHPIRNDQPTIVLSQVIDAAKLYQGESSQGPVSEKTCVREAEQMFQELHCSDPQMASRLAASVLNLPSPGETVFGFRLLKELGAGAFGRVYLATQEELAHRWMVLKIASDLHREPQTLARLQHTHIVPIYSVHYSAPLQAVCMPYFGSTTLADVLHAISQRASMPLSGKELLSTVLHKKDQSLRLHLEHERSHRGQAIVDPPASTTEVGDAQTTLSTIERLSYVEAILWAGARLADGLAYAHDRGILHRDLKPANIPVTDEGLPMLLDFNLAADLRARVPTAACIGGTLPYMAPEQLNGFQSCEMVADRRSDIYSLGLILFELLTGQRAYPLIAPGTTSEKLNQMVKDRELPPPILRNLNPRVTPAVDSILRRCLNPEPERRYQNAHELREDLQRQLESRRLCYAPDPSWRERAAKWTRRHPRLTSTSTVGAILTALLLTLGIWLGGAAYRHSRMEKAQIAYNQSQGDLRIAQFLLAANGSDASRRKQGFSAATRLLNRYQVFQQKDWVTGRLILPLSPEHRTSLKEDLGEVLWLMARARLSLAKTGSPRSSILLAEALRLNDKARECYSGLQAPRVIAQQRSQILAAQKKGPQPQRRHQPSEEQFPFLARDLYLLAVEQTLQGQYRKAVPLLERAVRIKPQHFWAWFILALCYDQLSNDVQALACYHACVALWPHYPWSYFNRGLVYLRLKMAKRAISDFSRVIRLCPRESLPYLNRALAWKQIGKPKYAIADLSVAIEKGAVTSRAYLLRSQFRQETGDTAGAKKDRQQGLKLPPHDARDYVARGLAQLPANPRHALAEFNNALAQAPDLLEALQNKAHVLADHLERPLDALMVLDNLLERYPDYLPGRSGRCLMMARLGHRRTAHQEAELLLRRTARPDLLYQIACAYAQTSCIEPLDRDKAFPILRAALTAGYGSTLLTHDPDLDPLRPDPRFQAILESFKPSGTSPTPCSAPK